MQSEETVGFELTPLSTCDDHINYALCIMHNRWMMVVLVQPGIAFAFNGNNLKKKVLTSKGK